MKSRLSFLLGQIHGKVCLICALNDAVEKQHMLEALYEMMCSEISEIYYSEHEAKPED